MKKLKQLLTFVLVLLALVVSAQSGKVTKAQRKAEDKKKELLRKEARAEVASRKQHASIQTKEVRKRMRKHRKGNIHVNGYDNRHSFFWRMFHRNKH